MLNRRGVHPGLPAGGPQKQEKDGRASAGIFRLGQAFGYTPRRDAPVRHGARLL